MSVTTFAVRFRRGWQSVDDVKLCADYLLHHAPGQRPEALIIVGYSYGSIAAAAAVADIPEVIGVATISPPLDWLAAGALYMGNKATLVKQAATRGGEAAQKKRPKLFLIGSADNFTSMPTFQDFVGHFTEPKTVRVIEGCDHFGIHRYVQRELSAWALEGFGISQLSDLTSAAPALTCPEPQPSSQATS